jgi:hypothetical protein
MEFYAGITGRDLFVVPRLTDDGDELHLQLNTAEYDQDETISAIGKYHLAGISGQVMHLRNTEYNARYLAEGGWDPGIRSQEFYARYLAHLFGPVAAPGLVQAFLTLEQNEKAMVYWGRSEIFRNFRDFSPLPDFRMNVNYRAATPTVTNDGRERINAAEDQRATAGEARLTHDELVRAIHATWGMGSFWKWRQAIIGEHAAAAAGTVGQHYADRQAQVRAALALLIQARPAVLPGSRAELEYVIYKTEGLVDYFEVLKSGYEATVTLDRAWLGLVDGDRVEFRRQVDECATILECTDRLARASAGKMIAYADSPTEKYLLLRYNRNVIGSIEGCRKFLAGAIAYANEGTKEEKTTAP